MLPRPTPRLAAWALPALCLAACAPSPESRRGDAIAIVGGESLTLADLDAHLLALPPPRRQVPPGTEPAQWMETQLRHLALQRVLEASQEMARLAASDEVADARARLRQGLLASALVAELAGEVKVDDEEVAARARELAARQESEPVLSFQHVFFRLDRDGDPQAVRARAERVAAEARAGGDFSALAREHSDSADAAGGGLVSQARPSDLDETSRQALAALAEDEASPLVESRTGLHLFRLVRRLDPEPPSAAQLEASAKSSLQQERLAAAREELLARLREGAGDPEADDEELLAAEAAARGLETLELARRLERTVRLQLLERLFHERRQAFDAELGEDRLRPFYDAQPALFSTPETTRVELIFVPQGRDSFATQKRVEEHVVRLRAGASFAGTAREVSEHPSAGAGGDLGFLTAADLARYGPAVAAAVPDLAVGEVSDPVYCTGRVLSREPRLLRGGFAVLRLAERREPRERGFEEAIDDVRGAYAAQHRRELDEALRDRILEEAGFEVLRLPDPDELAP